jgi:hypothetical protein
MIGILVGVFAVGLYLYKKFKDEQKKQKLEPMFIREVTNAKKPQQFSGQIVPVSKTGSSYTWSTWINITDYDYKRKDWKHIMHKGDKLGRNCQPGMWITPDMNNLVIRVATSAGGPAFVSKRGAPQFITEVERLVKTGELDNDQFRIIRNISTKDSLAKTYKEISKEHSDAKQIIVVMEGSVGKIDKNSQPVTYVIVKDANLIKRSRVVPNEQINSARNGLATFFTLEPNTGGVNYNPSLADIDNEGIGCVVENIPLNRWMHVAVVTYEGSFDVYIDGKLYKSIPLNGYLQDNGGDVFTCQNGGFGGMITQLRVFDRAIPVKHIDFLYKCGPACPMMPDLNAWLESVKPKFKVNLNVDIDVGVNGETYDLDGMASDAIETAVNTVEKGLAAVDKATG